MGVPAWQMLEKVSGLWDPCFSQPGCQRGTHVQDLWPISQCDQVTHCLRSVCVTKTEWGLSNWWGERISTEDLQRLLLLQFSYELQITFQNYFSQNTQTPPGHTADLLLKQAPGSARPVTFNHSAHSTTETETSAKRNMNDSGNWLQNWDGSRLFRSDVSVVWNVSRPGHFSPQVSSL